MQTALNSAYGIPTDPKTHNPDIQEQFIGPSVASDLVRSAIILILVASALIAIYLALAFRRQRAISAWRFSACAFFKLLHDVFVLAGIWAILGHFTSLGEVDTLFVTAILTSVAFSIHDTIVVFDRVRENLRFGPRLTFDQVINLSTVQTMTRSLNTSLTVVFVLLALVLFGGSTITGFVLALLIGIVTGTYSSIFNASTLLVAWQKASAMRAGGSPAAGFAAEGGARRLTHSPVQHMNTVSTEQLTELVQPSLRHLGLDLVDLQWRPGRSSVLRLVINSAGGVSLDDCERVSHAVGAVLDAYDPIAGRYALEVSSPGAERPLRSELEWQAAVGRRINVRVRSGDAELIVEGRLLHLDDTSVEIEARDRNRRRLTTVAARRRHRRPHRRRHLSRVRRRADPAGRSHRHAARDHRAQRRAPRCALRVRVRGDVPPARRRRPHRPRARRPAVGSCTMYRRGPDGEEVAVDVAVPDFPRQAAQAARAAVATALREAGKDRVLREASLRRGELIDTIVDTHAGPVWYLRAGEMRVLLPPEEQVVGEELVPGQHLKVMVLEGRRRSQDAVVVVSRSHPQLLRLLLEQEVPEVANGQVLVRGIVREAGRRSKVAVEAADPAVDARGACIGPRGVRHQAITSVLGGEQVQIVVWSGRPGHVHRQRPGAGDRARRRARRGHPHRHGDRRPRPALAGHRQGRGQRPAGRPALRLADRRRRR